VRIDLVQPGIGPCCFQKRGSIHLEQFRPPAVRVVPKLAAQVWLRE